MSFFHALGIGPLLGWAWDSFAATSEWTAKVVIALGALGGCVLFCWLVWWVGKKLYESYRGWWSKKNVCLVAEATGHTFLQLTYGSSPNCSEWVS